VEGDGDRPEHDRELDGIAAAGLPRLGQGVVAQVALGGTEVDGLQQELLDATAGSDGLVVDAGAWVAGALVLEDPVAEDRVDEGRTGTDQRASRQVVGVAAVVTAIVVAGVVVAAIVAAGGGHGATVTATGGEDQGCGQQHCGRAIESLHEREAPIGIVGR
jgi:hypothetical protein